MKVRLSLPVWILAAVATALLLIGCGSEVVASPPPLAAATPQADGWSAVAASGAILALQRDGSLWSWGWNGSGQLGLGFMSRLRTRPAEVGGGHDWSQVASGYDSSYAVRRDGTLWAWGGNGDGQLGLGDTHDRSLPTEVGSDHDWASVASGYDPDLAPSFTAAVKRDGSLWAWGYNGSGNLGQGFDGNDPITRPTRVGAASDWAAVEPGARLVLKRDGSLWLLSGEGHVPQQVDAARKWSAAASGMRDSLALTADGRLFRVGDFGALTPVAADHRWRAVACGNFDTLAIRSDGSLWGWGNNSSGELGVGDTRQHFTLTRVGTDLDWATGAAAGTVSVGLKRDGTFWSWGGPHSVVHPRESYWP